jgi:hypothetical protein
MGWLTPDVEERCTNRNVIVWKLDGRIDESQVEARDWMSSGSKSPVAFRPAGSRLVARLTARRASVERGSRSVVTLFVRTNDRISAGR